MRSAKQYAIQRSAPARLSDEIFCAECLKNQHLFTSSLAQYFPDDPSDPQYPELEKNYYKFRRGLEKRYPQVCEQCEPRVLERLGQAGYAAKADHLRRMMDKSRESRQVPKHKTTLDYANTVARWTWAAGLALEFIWHVASISMTLDEPSVLPEIAWISRAILALRQAVVLLPPSGVLIKLSFWANALTIWWNPLFVQVFRGFSKHVLGLSQWYTFQAIVTLTRFVLAYRGLSLSDVAPGSSKSAEISGHLFLAFFMILVSVVAKETPLDSC